MGFKRQSTKAAEMGLRAKIFVHLFFFDTFITRLNLSCPLVKTQTRPFSVNSARQ
jgi:hypothetical protein